MSEQSTRGNGRPDRNEPGDGGPPLSGEVQDGDRGFGRGAFRSRGRVWTWDDEDVRRGLPWFGVFLVVFGAILLVGQAYPEAHILGSALTTAIGIALLVSWATHRSWGLYPGLLISAFSLPGLLVDLRLLPAGSGYGSFLLGVGLLAIAAARWRARGTWGWQLLVGGVLAITGGAELADRIWPGFPSLGDILGPVFLLALGILILSRAVRR